MEGVGFQRTMGVKGMVVYGFQVEYGDLNN